jgi:predicted component of type VI protein secretion system
VSFDTNTPCNGSSAQMTEAMKNKKESKGKRTADSDVAGPKGNNNIGDNRPLLTLYRLVPKVRTLIPSLLTLFRSLLTLYGSLLTLYRSL